MYNSSPLRRAVFWVHLRQEVYNAYLYQRCVITDLSKYVFDPDADSNDDDIWFHQTLYIAAETTKWAFGEETSQARRDELHEMMDVWETRRPSSFDPIYFRSRDPGHFTFFPEIVYVTDEHVAAAHFFLLAKLLLTTHDPQLPRIGPRMKSAVAAMQQIGLSYVRTIIGIAICNNFRAARFTASLAIVICDSWFTDRREQEAILDFIRDTSRSTGWSRQNVERALIEEWGWKDKT